MFMVINAVFINISLNTINKTTNHCGINVVKGFVKTDDFKYFNTTKSCF